jgi:uncharacterized protein (DUF952 family)
MAQFPDQSPVQSPAQSPAPSQAQSPAQQRADGVAAASQLLHITPLSDWQAASAKGHYAAASLETEGFIHLSQPGQVVWVANQFYLGQSGLVLLCIDTSRLAAELRYDEVPGHGRFPHLYGPLNLDAVTGVLPFEPGAEGRFALPDGLAV